LLAPLPQVAVRTGRFTARSDQTAPLAAGILAKL